MSDLKCAARVVTANVEFFLMPIAGENGVSAPKRKVSLSLSSNDLDSSGIHVTSLLVGRGFSLQDICWRMFCICVMFPVPSGCLKSVITMATTFSIDLFRLTVPEVRCVSFGPFDR